MNCRAMRRRTALPHHAAGVRRGERADTPGPGPIVTPCRAEQAGGVEVAPEIDRQAMDRAIQDAWLCMTRLLEPGCQPDARTRLGRAHALDLPVRPGVGGEQAGEARHPLRRARFPRG